MDNSSYVPLYMQDTSWRKRYEESKATSVFTEGEAPRAGFHPHGGDRTFRRYPNGQLDLNSAMLCVLDILYKVRDHMPLDGMEQDIFYAIFPLAAEIAAPGGDPQIASQRMRLAFRLSPDERVAIADAVAGRLVEIHEYLLHGLK